MAKRQGFFNRLIMGSDNMPDFTPAQLPKTRWGLFADVFKNKLFEIFKLSLWGDLFLLPLVVFFIFNFINTRAYNIYIPYDANIGIGFPLETDAIIRGQSFAFTSEFQSMLIMIPLIVVLFLGMAGALYVMRRLVWGEPVTVTRHFFKGIKDNWKCAVVTGLLFSMSLFIMMFSFLIFGMLDNAGFINILMIIIAVIQFILVCGVALFAMTQSVTYKMKIKQILSNGFVFGFALVAQNVFFLFIAFFPVIIPEMLALFSASTRFTIAPIFYILYAILGVGFSMLVLTVYSQYAFDKYLNDRVEGAKKNRGMYVMTPEEEKRLEIERIKTHNVVYGAAYVAKRLSSINEGASITPLSASYSRADLQKLSEEKNRIKDEVEKERAEAEAQIAEEIKKYDEEQENLNKKNKKKKK